MRVVEPMMRAPGRRSPHGERGLKIMTSSTTMAQAKVAPLTGSVD